MRKSSRQVKYKAKVRARFIKASTFSRLIRLLKAYTVRIKKSLPPVTGPELHLPAHLSYTILRNRDTGDALKSEQDPVDAECWIKPIDVPPFGEQLKFHLRWHGKDEEGRLGAGIIDQDIHLPIEVLDGLAKLRDKLRSRGIA